MKNLLMITCAIFLFGLSSCAGGAEEENSTEQTQTETTEKEYACPMKCEGNKTYDKEGECPVCHMQLEEI